jgi:hypothetical protein
VITGSRTRRQSAALWTWPGLRREIAELVEHEQRVVAVTAEVSVPRRALLSSVGWALGTIHVENDVVGRFAGVDLVDPSAGESREGREVDVARQPLGLEAPHLAAGSRMAFQPLATDDGSHGWIAGEPLGVIDVLVAGEPAEHRLTEQSAQLVADVLAAPAIEQLGDCDLGEPDCIVEFAVSEQTAIGGDLAAVEFELDPAVEAGPQRRLFGFIRRVHHKLTLRGTSTC